VFGDESVTGKPVGDDLREGKPTPLLAVATARADSEQRAVLGRIGQPDLSPSDVSTIQSVMIETGAVSEIEATIDRLTTYAIAAIEQTPIKLDASAALVELAHYVAWRDR
jgi:geranylgeranyl diphosphate synthase, type I